MQKFATALLVAMPLQAHARHNPKDKPKPVPVVEPVVVPEPEPKKVAPTPEPIHEPEPKKVEPVVEPKKIEPKPEPIVEPTTVDDYEMDSYDDQITVDSTQTEAEYLVWLTDEILFSKALWNGFYSGVYSKHAKGMVPKPTEDCLGEWITKDIIDLKTFRNSMLTDYWNVSISQYQGAW